jgi:hypothetical protein
LVIGHEKIGPRRVELISPVDPHANPTHAEHAARPKPNEQRRAFGMGVKKRHEEDGYSPKNCEKSNQHKPKGNEKKSESRQT